MEGTQSWRMGKREGEIMGECEHDNLTPILRKLPKDEGLDRLRLTMSVKCGDCGVHFTIGDFIGLDKPRQMVTFVLLTSEEHDTGLRTRG